MDTNMTKIGVRLTNLDGRRTNDGGMPPVITGQYAIDYNKAMRMYGHNLSWTPEQWKDVYNDYSLRKWCPDANSMGFMASLWDMYSASITREERRHEINVARSVLKSELGPREFTLTYSNAWYAEDEDAQIAMKAAIEKLTRYYKQEIIEFHAVGEFTQANRAHVHCWYLLTGGRKITDKNFKRAWSHWNPKKKLGKGFEGGHHATITRVSDFAGYAEKHLEEAWLKVDITNAEVSNEGSEVREEGSEDDETG